MRPLLLVLPLLAISACAAPSSDDDATSSEANLGSSYDAMMKEACLEALGPVEANDAPALSDERARALSGEAALVDATMEVRYVTCSTRDYSGERPTCARIASRERVNTSYSPASAIEARESYRDLVGHIDVVATKPELVLEPRHGQFQNDMFEYEVSGTFEDLSVTMKPRSTSLTMPDDLEQTGSYSGITLQGRLADGKLTLATAVEPVVQWNVVSCARTQLFSTF
jgi:hypothetical protein